MIYFSKKICFLWVYWKRSLYESFASGSPYTPHKRDYLGVVVVVVVVVSILLVFSRLELLLSIHQPELFSLDWGVSLVFVVESRFLVNTTCTFQLLVTVAPYICGIFKTTEGNFAIDSQVLWVSCQVWCLFNFSAIICVYN